MNALRILSLVLALTWGGAVSSPAQETPDSLAADAPGEVLWTEVADVIGPVSARHITETIDHAEATGARLVVIALDTPGGLDTAMRTIIKRILASNVPVCVYIGPEGARAASAGVYISYAAHVNAMAPGTNLGSATPVQMGGGEMDSTMVKKVVHDAEAYIRSLARLRDRNAEWAVEAVTEAVSLPAEEALAMNVVDHLVTGPRDLLRQIDGRTVSLPQDKEQVLRTADATIAEYAMSWRYRILSVLNNPNIAYLLLMLGFYGLFFELSNPGAIFPGVIGAVCLILGLFALQSLSLNYAGLLLMILGAILFLLETQVASHGLLAIGGTVALFAGSLFLVDSPAPYLRVSMKVIVPAVLGTAGFFLFAVTMAVRAQRRRVTTGHEGLVGVLGVTRTALAPRGKVFVAGEHWAAESVDGTPIAEGTSVEIVSSERLLLRVRPAASR